MPKNKSYLNNRKNSTFSTRVYVWSDFSTTNLQWRIWIKFYDHRKSLYLKDKWSFPYKKAAETFDLCQQSTTTWGGLMANNFKYKHVLRLNMKQRKWLFAEWQLHYATRSNSTYITSKFANLISTRKI